MENRIRLSIPQPCPEKWETFTPNNTGGFCDSCQKTVIDFTTMTDAEVMQFLKTKPAHACGRFRKEQLKEYRDMPVYNIRPSRMLLKAGLISLLLALIAKPSFSQSIAKERTTTEVVETVKKKGIHGDRIVRGIVVDSDENLPLLGINIVLRGSIMGTVTDVEGKFEFPVPLKEGDQLTFSFIGLQTTTYTVSEFTEASIVVTLAPDVTVLGGLITFMGEVDVTDESVQKKPARSWFAAIKSWF